MTEYECPIIGCPQTFRSLDEWNEHCDDHGLRTALRDGELVAAPSEASISLAPGAASPNARTDGGER